MTETSFGFKDKSNDRKYFSIVPNFIVNHSTFEEQGFYLTLKRIAGEHGKIFYSPRKLAEMGGVGKDKVYQLIKSLLKRGWIKEAGVIPAKTKPRMTYEIVDLWDKNNDFYKNKKIVCQTDNLPKRKRLSATQTKIVGVADTKEEQGKEEPKNTVEAKASVIKRNVDNSGDNRIRTNLEATPPQKEKDKSQISTNSRTPYGNCTGCTDPDPLGGTHQEGTYQHPFPENKQGIASIGEILKRLKTKPDAPSKTKYPWQDEAIRIWHEIGLRGSPSGSFFKLFKLAYQKGEQSKLSACLSYCKDAEGIKDMEKLFYWRFANKPERKHDL